jgi:hypothetical protein
MTAGQVTEPLTVGQMAAQAAVRTGGIGGQVLSGGRASVVAAIS